MVGWSASRAPARPLPVSPPRLPFPRLPSFVALQLLPLHRLQQLPRLIGIQLLDRFTFGRAVAAAGHGTRGGFGIPLVAGHVHVPAPVVRVAATAGRAAVGPVLV